MPSPDNPKRKVSEHSHPLPVGDDQEVSARPGWRFPGRKRNRIGIIGCGIIGSSIAYHLARRGAAVILFEKLRPAAGVTENSFAWINSTWGKRSYHYYQLNRLGAKGWLHLDREWKGALNLQWTGSLSWSGDPEGARELQQQVAQHQVWGYPAYLIDPDELRSMEEQIVPGPVLAAAFCEYEGSVDPTHTTQVFLNKAQEHGARVERPCEVLGIDIRSGRLHGVHTTQGDFEVDTLVVAAGVYTAGLAAMAGLQVPLIDSPGLLAHTKPTSRLIQRVIRAPGVAMKQDPDGRIVTGAGFGGSPSTDTSRERGEQILAKAARFLPGIRDVELDRVTLGWRPYPRDDHPIVGFDAGAPDIYLAVMHSGITLAPIIGQLAALEILDDVRVEMLKYYRLSRFDEKKVARGEI